MKPANRDPGPPQLRTLWRWAGLLGLALFVAPVGCASPSGWDGIGPKIVGAPLLTYVDGDPEAGTTTLVSLPLLTYRGTREAPGYRQSKTCFTPLLMHQQTTLREIRVVQSDDAAHCPDDDPLAPSGGPRPPVRVREAEPARPLTSREKARRGISVSGSSRPLNRRTRRARPESRSEARRAPSRGEPETSRTKRKKEGTRSQYKRLERRDGREWRGYTLALKQSGRVLEHTYPAKRTELNVLWPLIKLASERPGRVGFRPDVGTAKVYEVGNDSTEVRFLPLFSHERRGESSKTILWPLLGFGWETTPKGTYIRLFYFLRFKIG
jgi:hypothetical protein